MVYQDIPCRAIEGELKTRLSSNLSFSTPGSRTARKVVETGEITDVSGFVTDGVKIFEIDVKSEDVASKIADQIRKENSVSRKKVSTSKTEERPSKPKKRPVDVIEKDYDESDGEEGYEYLVDRDCEASIGNCGICGNEFSSTAKLENHMRTCFETSEVICKVCGKNFANKRNLRDHMRVFHESPAVLDSKYSLPCSECDKIFYKKSNLTSHMLRHSSEKPFVCDVQGCGKTFKREKTLVKHFQLVHEGIKTELLCVHCGAQFRSHSGLRAHLSVHTGEETVKRDVRCTQCEKVFRCKADLESHMVVHTRDKPYSCDICGQAFSQKASLKDHENVHMEKYQCAACKKSFGRERYLKLHRKTCVHLNTPQSPQEGRAVVEEGVPGEVQHIIISSVGGGGKEGEVVQVVQVPESGELAVLHHQGVQLVVEEHHQEVQLVVEGGEHHQEHHQLVVEEGKPHQEVQHHQGLQLVVEEEHQGVQVVVEGGEQVVTLVEEQHQQFR